MRGSYISQYDVAASDINERRPVAFALRGPRRWAEALRARAASRAGLRGKFVRGREVVLLTTDRAIVDLRGLEQLEAAVGGQRPASLA